MDGIGMAERLNATEFTAEFTRAMTEVLEGQPNAPRTAEGEARYRIVHELVADTAEGLVAEFPELDIANDGQYHKFATILQDTIYAAYNDDLERWYGSLGEDKVQAAFEELSNACIDAAVEIYALNQRASREVLSDAIANQDFSFSSTPRSYSDMLKSERSNGFSIAADRLGSATRKQLRQWRDTATDTIGEVFGGVSKRKLVELGIMGSLLFGSPPKDIQPLPTLQGIENSANPESVKLAQWTILYSNYFQAALQQTTYGAQEGYAAIPYKDGAIERVGFGTSMSTKQAAKVFEKCGIDFAALKKGRIALTQNDALKLLHYRAKQHADSHANDGKPMEDVEILNALQDAHSANPQILKLLQAFEVPEFFGALAQESQPVQKQAPTARERQAEIVTREWNVAEETQRIAEQPIAETAAPEQPKTVEWDIKAERLAAEQSAPAATPAPEQPSPTKENNIDTETRTAKTQETAAETNPGVLERVTLAISEIKTLTPKFFTTSSNSLAEQFKKTEQKLGERFAKIEVENSLSHSEKKELKKQGVGFIDASTTPSDNPRAYMSRPLLEKTLAGLENASQQRDYGNYNNPASRTFYAGLGIALEGAEGEGTFVYKCSSDKPTVGFGCRVDLAGNREMINKFFDGKYDGMKLLRGQQGIAKDDARDLLHYMLASYERAVVNYIGKDVYAKLPVGLQAALVDMAYNGGVGEKKTKKGKNGLVGPTLKRLLQEDKIEEAINHIAAYCNANNLAGLGDRRTFTVGMILGTADVVGSEKQAALKIEQQLRRNVNTVKANDFVVIETDASVSAKHLENYAPTLEKVVKDLNTPVLITSSAGDTVLVTQKKMISNTSSKDVSFIENFRGHTKKIEPLGHFTEMLSARAESESQGKPR
jgi:GH24 family phage-related lysozyme (muramidase)